MKKVNHKILLALSIMATVAGGISTSAWAKKMSNVETECCSTTGGCEVKRSGRAKSVVIFRPDGTTTTTWVSFENLEYCECETETQADDYIACVQAFIDLDDSTTTTPDGKFR